MLSHVILYRDQPLDASKQDRELKQDHTAHCIKVLNGMTIITQAETRFDDQRQDQHRNMYARQDGTSFHQVTYHLVPRQDIGSRIHTMDLSNTSLSGIGERTVFDQQETDSMSALKDQDSKEKDGQGRSNDPVKQFHENRIFNNESELNIIAAIDANEAKLKATREEGSQEEYVTRTISYVEPDDEEVHLLFGWGKASSVTPRLGLLVTDTFSLFHIKSRCIIRHKAADTVSLDTPTINTEGVYYIAWTCHSMTSHMTRILELKQDMFELKQEKQICKLAWKGHSLSY
jgi:hypothetical protein